MTFRRLGSDVGCGSWSPFLLKYEIRWRCWPEEVVMLNDCFMSPSAL